MKKYRFGDPAKVSFLRKYGNFLYFFCAWNLCGVVIWKIMNRKKAESDENWNNKSSTERYLSMIGYGEENKTIKRIKLKGLHQETTSTTEEN